MSFSPVFKIGIWNAWILQLLMFLSMFIPDFFLDKEARERSKRLSRPAPLKKFEKWLAISTHAVIMPVVLVYSVFLPLKTGTLWLYAGLPIFAIALVIFTAAIFDAGATPADKPVTRGVYRISRHPIYLSGFLMYLSIAICCSSWVVLLCAVLWITLWCIVVPTEERLLIERYGDSYREYRDRIPRWLGIPRSP